MKKEAGDKKLSDTDQQKLTEEEKEYKSLRKQIQDKLIKFATRIPIFMYLTDYREHSLKDVITKIDYCLRGEFLVTPSYHHLSIIPINNK